MFSFLQRKLPASGRVFYPGVIPPPFEQFSQPGDLGLTRTTPSADQTWAAEAAHPAWGKAELACPRQPVPFPPELVEHTLSLTDEEKALARRGESAVIVRLLTQPQQVLKDRKRLLFWLRRLLDAGGVMALDDGATLFWSRAMLDDELAHEADLDIESLYTIHAVQESETEQVEWLHTHGLEPLGGFDLDVLQPSPLFTANCGDPLRALAFATLEGVIAPDTDRFMFAYPGGEIRLVPVDRFHADAAPEHRRLRNLDEAHAGRRAVVCEPVGGLFGRWRSRPVPSRFLSTVSSDQLVVTFSKAATDLMSERARHTLAIFRALKEEFASLELPAVVKLGYQVEGGAADDREHLWFTVHQVFDDRVDATLANAPHRVPSLKEGQRGEFGLDRLTDWTILSPEGSMTPRNVSAARRLRANRASWQTLIDRAKRDGAQ